jgi:hypothetical protein
MVALGALFQNHVPIPPFSQNGKRIDRIGMWLVGWNDVAAIWNPPPTVKARRSFMRNLPSTRPSVRYTNVLPGWLVGTILPFPP